MKKNLLSALAFILVLPFFSLAQEKDTLAPNQTYTPPATMVQKEREPNHIKSGFYIKLGPVFPVKNYKLHQSIEKKSDTSVYLPAKMGGALDMGYLIYIGPAFARNHIRLGIDATFISFSFNPVDTSERPSTKYWYYYLGQKFGPLVSICPVDRLIIDISYKLNAYMAYNNHKIRGGIKDEWGKNLTQSELSMSIRYSLILFSFQYNFGKTAYNDFDSVKPIHYIDNSTFRIMIGFKF